MNTATALTPLDLRRYRRIVVLTGAGISAGSGLFTFRGPGGVWNDDVAWLSDAANLPASLPAIWAYYGKRRAVAAAVAPNAAHTALAVTQQRLTAAQTLTLITQNVDGLHQRAGSIDTIELHGGLFRTRCIRATCTLVPFADTTTPDEVPLCLVCGAALRPDIVLFNEIIPAEADWRSKRALRDCDLFLAVGTSGVVAPASSFVRGAAYAGALTMLVNLTPSDPPNPAFHTEVIGPAEVVLPLLLGTGS